MTIDNEDTGYRITQRFLEAGHRAIAFLGGTLGLASAEARVRGYARAMQEAGAEPQIIGRTGMSHEDGSRAAREAMAGRSRPTALISTNDELAIGAFAELLTLGYRVPEDVSLGCVGGTRTTRAFGLTHIALPLAELGYLAAKYVADPQVVQFAASDVPDFAFIAGRTLRTR